MAYRKWTIAQQQEAVALAAVIGAEAAAEQLGMTAETIRGWAERAGVRVADTIDAPSWERLARLALARTESLIASGTMKPSQYATVAAIATRNAAKPKAEEPTDPDDDLLDWIDAHYPSSESRALAREASTWAIRAALRAGPPDDGPPSAEMGADVNAWLQDLLTATPDLEAFCADHRERRRRDIERRRVIGDRAAVLRSSGMVYHEAMAMAAELTTDYPDPYAEAMP